MAKPSLIFFSFCFTCLISFAQHRYLEIKGSGSDFYIEHVVIAKENFYSIARTFNVPPKEIAGYNNLQFEDGLSVGQVLKIPLTEFNFIQNTSASIGEALIPVFHSVEPKEGLYRISVNYKNVPIPSLKEWNVLQSDEVGIGTPLVVGYLKVDKTQSYLANKQSEPGNEIAAISEGDKKAEVAKPDVNPEALPPVRNPDIQREESKSLPAAEQSKATVIAVKTKSNIDFSGGYFRKLYSDQVENKSPLIETGTAGVFKSTSGWQDGKYYCFNNDAPPGTVIKITDNSTGKSVFAKVLDAIPEIKQNEGLSVIVSNSAAEELGTGENRFDCALTFAK